jgi:hypothetical protein
MRSSQVSEDKSASSRGRTFSFESRGSRRLFIKQSVDLSRLEPGSCDTLMASYLHRLRLRNLLNP